MKNSMEEMNDSSLNYSSSPFIANDKKEENEQDEIEENFSPGKNEICNSETNEYRVSSGVDIRNSKNYEIKSGKAKNKKINFNKYLIDTNSFANSLKQYNQGDLITSGKIGKNYFKIL